jgi:hypothetical protein
VLGQRADEGVRAELGGFQYLAIRYTERLAEIGAIGLDHVELATLEWVDWFSNRRLHSARGDVPPVELSESTTVRSPPSKPSRRQNRASTEPGAVHSSPRRPRPFTCRLSQPPPAASGARLGRQPTAG